MKQIAYSTYEAKARFSEILRKVRGGESVLISYRGKNVAEIRPIERDDSQEERLRRLESAGVVSSLPERRGGLEAVAERPGALDRFIASRDEDD